MISKRFFDLILLAASAIGLASDFAQAQLETGFTYQGQLKLDGTPVSAACDFEFSLWDDPTTGSQIGMTQHIYAHPVVDGLFTVLLNAGDEFGSDAFNGQPRWLEITVTVGEGSPVTLSPRQPVTPTPYAFYSEGAPWGGLYDVPAGFADGVDDDTTYSAGTGLLFEPSESLFQLDPLYMLPQACADGQMPKWNDAVGLWICANDETGAGEFWSLTGNSGIDPLVNFLGTTDETSLELRVNGVRALRLEPNAFSLPNLIGGCPDNSVSAGVIAATIGGGGDGTYPNRVTDSHGTVSGGGNNRAGDDDADPQNKNAATVGGGWSNTASGQYSTVGGGRGNIASGWYSLVGGGWVNYAEADFATIAGGGPSDVADQYNTNNRVYDHYGTVGGGGHNRAGNDDADPAIAIYATVSGGLWNVAEADNATVGGGEHHTASGSGSTVAGGRFNIASGSDAVIAGGYNSVASGQSAAVGGGAGNEASGAGATIPGGMSNRAGGDYSFAAGRQAQADHNGSFVWADSTGVDFASTGDNQFLIRAAGGVGIGTDSPFATLHLAGDGAARLRFDDGQTTNWILQSTTMDDDSLTISECDDFACVARARFKVGGYISLVPGGGIVGIGTGSATSPLTVVGMIESTIDGFKFPDGTVQTTAATGGGNGWSITGNAGTDPSSNFLGTLDSVPLEIRVNDDRALRIEPRADSPCLIGGYAGNAVAAEAIGATIAGGGYETQENSVYDHYSVIGGGSDNIAGLDDGYPTEQGYATVGGGFRNYAQGSSSTVGGGYWNYATGNSATVPGGYRNEANGDYSLAAGRRAKAEHNGAFVWADSEDSDFASTALNQFLIRAGGGVGIGTSSPQYALDVVGTARAGNVRADEAVTTEALNVQGGGPTVASLYEDPSYGGCLLAYGPAGVLDSGIAIRGHYPASGGGLILAYNDENSQSAAIFGDAGNGGSQVKMTDGLGHLTIEMNALDAEGGGSEMIMRDSDSEVGVHIEADDAGGGGLVEVKDGEENSTITLRGSDGYVITKVLQITGGSDLSEHFDVSSSGAEVRPGMVVCIDPDRPGELLVSTQAYDHTVAGIISGAGGVKPGVMMGQAGTPADGAHPVALTGRVWAWCDASSSLIEPGDLLTTSDVAGHAMRVTDYTRAQGAIIGKAMTSLTNGRGLVLVLVSLQ